MEGQTSNPSGATITVPKEQYDRFRKDMDDALHRAETLRQQLVAERALTPDERLANASELIEAFKTITDHAVANLSPEFIRDLPAEAFVTAANLVDKVVGATQRDTERAGVWFERAGLIQTWRDKRKARGWGEDADPVVSTDTVAPATNFEDAVLNEIVNSADAVRAWTKRNGYKLVPYAKRGRKSAAKAAPTRRTKAKPTKRTPKKKVR